MHALWLALVVVAVASCGRPVAPASGGAAPAAFVGAAAPSPRAGAGGTTGEMDLTAGSSQLRLPAAADPDLDALVTANTDWALDTYRRLRTPGRNLTLAPYTASVAMAMVYAGARGSTATGIESALRFPLPGQALHAAFARLALALRRDAGGALEPMAGAWIERAYPVLPGYLDLLATYYGATAEPEDFASAPEAARAAINRQVSDATAGGLPSLLPDGSIDALTRLVLASVIDVHGVWQNAFDPAATAKAAFFASPRLPAESVDTMVGYGNYRVARSADYQAVELPFRDSHLALLLVVPSDLAAFEDNLDASALLQIVAGLAPETTLVYLPKLALGGQTVDLVQIIADQGAFDAVAGGDFSGISPANDLRLAHVEHAARITWDERGAVASGATAAIFDEDDGALPPGVSFNQPFVLFLRDTLSGAVLFVGRVVTTTGP